MRSLFCLLALSLASAGAVQLTEGAFEGPRQIASEENQKATVVPDQKGGLILILPKKQDTLPSRTFTLRTLAEEETDVIMQAIGGSISKVKSPKDAIAKSAPNYPFGMLKRGATGRAICLFEVTQKGFVGRVFKVGDGSDEFFQECVRALEQWRFPKQSDLSYRIIEFSAEKE